MSRRSLVLFILLGGLALGHPAPVASAAKPELTVSAAASFKDALEEIDAGYPAATVHANYGASGSLQQQIVQGAPVDVFISAAKKNMDELEKASLIDPATRKDVAANRLVLVVPANAPKLVTSFHDLGKDSVRQVALGTPETVPAGKYAQQVLHNLYLADKVNAKAVLCKDVRGVLTQVELGNVDAGIVYRTDALISDKVRIVATSPENLHQPIRYPVAVVSASKNSAAAAAYTKYLNGPKAQAVLRKYGFLAP